MGLNRNLGQLTEVITEGGGNIGIGGTPNAGFRVDVNGTGRFSSTVQASAFRLTGMTAGSGALYWSSDRVTLANYNPTGVVMIEANGGAAVATFGGATFNNDFVGTGRFSGNVAINGSSLDINPSSGNPNITLRTGNTFRGYIEGNSNGLSFGAGASANIYFTLANSGAATFSSSVTATQGFLTATANTYAGGALRLTAHTGGRQIFLTSVGTNFALSNGGSADHLIIASTGAATFSSSVTTTFLNIGSSNGQMGSINSSNANGGYITWETSGVTIADIGTSQQIFGAGGNDTFGINARGARNIVFGSNNTERMRIFSSGNVFIGSSPVDAGNRLEVTGTGNNWAGSFTGSTTTGQSYGAIVRGGTNSSDVAFSVNNAANSTTYFRVRGDGNVGIGTTSPTNYSGFNTLQITGKSDTGGGVLRLTSFDSSAGVNFYAQTGGIFTNTTTSSPIVWLTQDTERMRITSGGDIEIKKSDSRIRGGDASGRVILSNSDTTAYVICTGSSNGNSIDLVTNQHITFNSGPSYSERMRIFSNGNVYIGSSPTDNGARLRVNGRADIGGTVITTAYGGSGSVTTEFAVPGSLGGLFIAKGFNVSNGVSFSVIYNVVVRVPGGGGSDVYYILISQNGVSATFTFDNNGGYLRINPSANIIWTGSFISAGL